MIANTQKFPQPCGFAGLEMLQRQHLTTIRNYSVSSQGAILQAVRSQSMTFTMRDANGFTPAEAAELKRRIADVERGNAVAHSIVED